MDTVIRPRKVPLTLQDEYNGDKKSFDAYLAAGEKPQPKAPKGTIGMHDGEQGMGQNEGLQILGVDAYDIDNAVYSFPDDPELLTGTEGFLKSISDGITRLLKLVKDFFLWLKELVINKVARLRNKVNDVKGRLAIDGITSHAERTYPLSVDRLTVNQRLPLNATWVATTIKSLKDIQLWTNSLDDYLAQQKKRVMSITSQADYYAAVKEVTAGMESFFPLKRPAKVHATQVNPGNKYFFTFMGDLALKEYPTFGLGIIAHPILKSQKFIPDRLNVDNVIKHMEVVLRLIERRNTSADSRVRGFTREIENLLNANVYPDATAQRAAKQYLSWLVGFYQKVLSVSFQYVSGTLYAAAEFCEANVRKI